MRCSVATIAVLSALAVGQVAQGAEVAYVEWTSAYSEGLPADWGYNAFDGKKGTAWCSSDDPGAEMLTLGFIGQQPVTEIGVIVGALKKGTLDKSRARLKEIEISDGLNKISLRFRDKPTMQYIKIRPNLRSQKMTFKVLDVFSGERRSSPICISEIRLKRGGTEVTGDHIGRQIRSLTRPKQRLLHLWIDQPGAPERYLTFSLSGNFLWVFKPILEGKPTKIGGTWTLVGNRLTLTSRSGNKHYLKANLDRIADGDQVFKQLTIDGDGPHSKFPGTYQTTNE